MAARPSSSRFGALLCALALLLSGCTADATPDEDVTTEPGRDLAVLYRLLVEPAHSSPRLSDRATTALPEAVGDMLARLEAPDQGTIALYSIVAALGAPVVAEEPWADLDARHTLANRELQALLGDRYDVFLQEVAQLWQRAEPCLPSCTEADLYAGGERPLGITEQAVGQICPRPSDGPSTGGQPPTSSDDIDVDVDVTLGALPPGIEPVDDLPQRTGVAEQYGGSNVGRAVARQLLAVGDPAMTTDYVNLTTVIDAHASHCATLWTAARSADRRADASGPVTVDGQVGVLHAPDDANESGLLIWLATDEVMVQLLSEGATAAHLLEIAEAVEIGVTADEP